MAHKHQPWREGGGGGGGCGAAVVEEKEVKALDGGEVEEAL